MAAVQIGGDDPELGHPVHGPERHAIAGGEGAWHVRPYQLTRDDHARELRERWRRGNRGQQLGVERHAEDHRGPVARRDRREDAVRREPVGEYELHARVQAVQQAADQAENVHNRREADDPLTLARVAVQLGVAVEFPDEVARGTRDHLGRPGRAGAELYQRVAGGGRAAAGTRQRRRSPPRHSRASRGHVRRAVRDLHERPGVPAARARGRPHTGSSDDRGGSPARRSAKPRAGSPHNRARVVSAVKPCRPRLIPPRQACACCSATRSRSAPRSTGLPNQRHISPSLPARRV